MSGAASRMKMAEDEKVCSLSCIGFSAGLYITVFCVYITVT